MNTSDEPAASPDGTDPNSRRGFLTALTLALGAVPILGGLWAALRSGLAPTFSDKPAKVPLCKLDEVPATGIKQVAVSFAMREGPAVVTIAKVVFVTRDPESQQVLALAGECTHLSCPVQARELKIRDDSDAKAPLTCPCHGGMFSQTGEVLAGPPEQPLTRLKIELPAAGDGTIYLLDL